MSPTTEARQQDHLDALAGRMAAATDAGDLHTAWQILRQVDPTIEPEPANLPPAPVLARRFARAHRRALVSDAAHADRLARALSSAGPPRHLVGAGL